MKTTKSTEQYKNRQENIKDLIGKIKNELKAHQKEANAQGPHFGHVGDLGYVEEQLTRAYNFLAQIED